MKGWKFSSLFYFLKNILKTQKFKKLQKKA